MTAKAMKEVNTCEPIRVNVGHPCEVYIDKLFGPLVACELRITLDYENVEWVVERQRYDEPEYRWEEVSRFDCQFPNKDEEESK